MVEEALEIMQLNYDKVLFYYCMYNVYVPPSWVKQCSCCSFPQPARLIAFTVILYGTSAAALCALNSQLHIHIHWCLPSPWSMVASIVSVLKPVTLNWTTSLVPGLWRRPLTSTWYSSTSSWSVLGEFQVKISSDAEELLSQVKFSTIPGTVCVVQGQSTCNSY